MLARLHNQPFVLVATTRPGLDERWTPAPGKHNELALHLDPLDRESTAELVRALFCGGADDETVEFLLERSGGNPFFVEELVAFVQETRDSNRLHELPATLHGLVAARLDALAAAERSLLEDCAIVGASGPIAAVLALASRARRPPAARRSGGTRLPRHRARRVPFQVGADPRDRVRHAHQGRARSPPRAGCAGTRGARRTGRRPGRAPSRHRGRARRRVRHRRRGSPRRARAGNRDVDARRRTRRVGRVVAHGRTPPRPRPRAAGPGEHPRSPDRAARSGPGPRAPPCARRRARRRADRARGITRSRRSVPRGDRADVARRRRSGNRRLRRRRGDVRRSVEVVERARRRVGRGERPARARHDAPLPR